VIKQTPLQRFEVERDPAGGALPIVINLESTPRREATFTIVRAFLEDTIQDELWFLEQLGRRAKVEVDTHSLGRALFMTWDQVRRIADSRTGASLTVGSHAHSHSSLGQLGKDSQWTELAQSKQILEARLGREITALAYPYGRSGSYTEETKKLVKQAGYRMAFTSHEGVNRPGDFDPFEIVRLGIGSSDSLVVLRARMALHTAFGHSAL
jgi:hypothetical protein